MRTPTRVAAALCVLALSFAGCHATKHETPTPSSSATSPTTPSSSSTSSTTPSSTETSEPRESTTSSTAPSTSTTTSTSATTSAAPGAPIAIPDVTGQDAEDAKHQLENLGFTDVAFNSVDPKHKEVILPLDWTVASVNPAPGTKVSADSSVVLNVNHK